ncbi:MAG TPA: GNAT family N-acetyltransferase [Arthrobacter sp.]|nr:GNAT family N-acetyltransferase [Arthrobacter sp.]
MTSSAPHPVPPITIRPATAADYPEIARITVDSYLSAGHFEDPEHPYLQVVQQVAERHAAAEILVAERDGAVIGAVTLVRAGNPYADIALENELEFRMLVVDPAVQRSGAGRAMMQEIIRRGRAMDGVNAISLTTGSNWMAAQALYTHLGFRNVPERDWFVPDTDILLKVYILPL